MQGVQTRNKMEIVSIGLAGDVMLGRGVNHYLHKATVDYPWGNVLPIMKSTDLNIINLENTFTYSRHMVPKLYNFKAEPEKVEVLKPANIRVANLANNHILDYAVQGLFETIETLDQAGILHTGAGKNAREASKEVIVQQKDVTIGMLGFTDNEPTWKAIDLSGVDPGTNYLDTQSTYEIAKALEMIEELKAKVDICIISIHWGPNMVEKPDFSIVQLAHRMIESGADIIHGHSAHIFQGIEVYLNKLILYDTGDFVDDYVVHPSLKNDHSFFFIVEASKLGIHKLRLIPVRIHKYQVNLAKGEDYDWCMNRIKELSAEFGTRISEEGEVLVLPM